MARVREDEGIGTQVGAPLTAGDFATIREAPGRADGRYSVEMVTDWGGDGVGEPVLDPLVGDRARERLLVLADWRTFTARFPELEGDDEADDSWPGPSPCSGTDDWDAYSLARRGPWRHAWTGWEHGL